MLFNLLDAAIGFGKTILDDMDDLLVKLVGDILIIDPIAEID